MIAAISRRSGESTSNAAAANDTSRTRFTDSRNRVEKPEINSNASSASAAGRMSAGSTALAEIAAGCVLAGGQTASTVATATGEGSSDSEATALACESSCGSALGSTSSTVPRDVL